MSDMQDVKIDPEFDYRKYVPNSFCPFTKGHCRADCMLFIAPSAHKPPRCSLAKIGEKV